MEQNKLFIVIILDWDSIDSYYDSHNECKDTHSYECIHEYSQDTEHHWC